MSKSTSFSKLLYKYGAFSAMAALATMMAVAALGGEPNPSDVRRPIAEYGTPPQGIYKAGRLLGKAVKNPKGETLGKVSEVVIDGRGQIKYFVLAHGGVLGKETRKTAIAWELLRFSPKGSPYLVGISKKQLAGLPTFKEDKWPAEAQVTEFGTLQRR